jgi:uncharacterized cupredoxin-like copper-binding protein
MTSRPLATHAEHDDTAAAPRPASPRLRIREALVAAFALACFSAATPASGTVLAQVEPGEPTADVPLADPGQPVPVEFAMRMEDGALVCRPDLDRLPPNEELTLQLVNATDAEAAFSAPAFFAAAGRVASTIDAEYDHDAGAFVVPAGTTGQIVFTSGEEGTYEFACAPAGEEATMQGEIVVEE